MPERVSPSYHTNAEQFRDALSFTEADRGFAARLIEKDYYCSLVLHDLLPLYQMGLTFKGGTSLSKVHTNFYRLSEDLDFVIHVEYGISRSDRRRLIDPVKHYFAALPDRMPCFRVSGALTAHNASTQYIGRLLYRSCVTGQDEPIKIEIGLREPILEPTLHCMAQTLLIDPFRAEPALAPIPVATLSLLETYAEKIRAALSRREPAIRDFFDLDHAIRTGVLPLDNPTLIHLAARKLGVSGRDSIDVTEHRLAALRQQLSPQLKPVLRDRDYEGFDLVRAFQMICDLHTRLALSGSD